MSEQFASPCSWFCSWHLFVMTMIVLRVKANKKRISPLSCLHLLPHSNLEPWYSQDGGHKSRINPQLFFYLCICAHGVPESVRAYVCEHITVPDSFQGWSNSPRLTSVRATHRTSATSAGKISALLITFPYFCWKGSIIVTYLFSLIGLAKKKPPGTGGKVFTLS